MLPFSLVLVLASALAADLSPRQLIVLLDSPDRVVREEAARTLEERGAEALPALLAARDAAKSPEARERFAGLIDRVEARASIGRRWSRSMATTARSVRPSRRWRPAPAFRCRSTTRPSPADE